MASVSLVRIISQAAGIHEGIAPPASPRSPSPVRVRSAILGTDDCRVGRVAYQGRGPRARAAFGGARASLTGNPTDAIRLPFHQWPGPRPAGSSPRPVSKSQAPGTPPVRDADITDAGFLQAPLAPMVLAARLPHPGVTRGIIDLRGRRQDATTGGRLKPFMERQPNGRWSSCLSRMRSTGEGGAGFSRRP